MKTKRLTITIPEDLYNILYEQAAEEMRTVSNQLTYILTNHFAPLAPSPFTHPHTTPIPATPYDTLNPHTDRRTTLSNTTNKKDISDYQQHI